MEIIPGIHHIEVPNPSGLMGPTNVYLVKGTDGWLLVDTGWDHSEARETLDAQLHEIGIGFDAIEQIVITHIHVDHYSLLDWVRQRSGAKVLFHERDYEILAAMSLGSGDYSPRLLHQFEANGFPDDELSQLEKLYDIGKRIPHSIDPPDKILQDGDKIFTGMFTFEVIWTPGHSPGNICLYESERKLLLTGDHVLPVTTSNINMHAPTDDNPLNSFFTSLAKVAKLDVELVLPGHEHIFAHLQERVDGLLSHHDKRLTHVLKGSKGEGKTAYQIAYEVPWIIEVEEFKNVSFVDLNVLDKAMAVGETLAHLEYLRYEGNVVKESQEGIVFYKATGVSL